MDALLEEGEECSRLREEFRHLIVPLIRNCLKDKPKDLTLYCARYFLDLLEERNKSSELQEINETGSSKDETSRWVLRESSLQGSTSLPILTDSVCLQLREASSWSNPSDPPQAPPRRRKIQFNVADAKSQIGDQTKRQGERSGAAKNPNAVGRVEKRAPLKYREKIGEEAEYFNASEGDGLIQGTNSKTPSTREVKSNLDTFNKEQLSELEDIPEKSTNLQPTNSKRRKWLVGDDPSMPLASQSKSPNTSSEDTEDELDMYTKLSEYDDGLEACGMSCDADKKTSPNSSFGFTPRLKKLDKTTKPHGVSESFSISHTDEFENLVKSVSRSLQEVIRGLCSYRIHLNKKLYKIKALSDNVKKLKVCSQGQTPPRKKRSITTFSSLNEGKADVKKMDSEKMVKAAGSNAAQSPSVKVSTKDQNIQGVEHLPDIKVECLNYDSKQVSSAQETPKGNKEDTPKERGHDCSQAGVRNIKNKGQEIQTVDISDFDFSPQKVVITNKVSSNKKDQTASQFKKETTIPNSKGSETANKSYKPPGSISGPNSKGSNDNNNNAPRQQLPSDSRDLSSKATTLSNQTKQKKVVINSDITSSHELRGVMNPGFIIGDEFSTDEFCRREYYKYPGSCQRPRVPTSHRLVRPPRCSNDYTFIRSSSAVSSKNFQPNRCPSRPPRPSSQNRVGTPLRLSTDAGYENSRQRSRLMNIGEGGDVPYSNQCTVGTETDTPREQERQEDSGNRSNMAVENCNVKAENVVLTGTANMNTEKHGTKIVVSLEKTVSCESHTTDSKYIKSDTSDLKNSKSDKTNGNDSEKKTVVNSSLNPCASPFSPSSLRKLNTQPKSIAKHSCSDENRLAYYEEINSCIRNYDNSQFSRRLNKRSGTDWSLEVLDDTESVGTAYEPSKSVKRNGTQVNHTESNSSSKTSQPEVICLNSKVKGCVNNIFVENKFPTDHKQTDETIDHELYKENKFYTQSSRKKQVADNESIPTIQCNEAQVTDIGIDKPIEEETGILSACGDYVSRNNGDEEDENQENAPEVQNPVRISARDLDVAINESFGFPFGENKNQSEQEGNIKANSLNQTNSLELSGNENKFTRDNNNPCPAFNDHKKCRESKHFKKNLSSTEAKMAKGDEAPSVECADEPLREIGVYMPKEEEPGLSSACGDFVPSANNDDQPEAENQEDIPEDQDALEDPEIPVGAIMNGVSDNSFAAAVDKERQEDEIELNFSCLSESDTSELETSDLSEEDYYDDKVTEQEI